MGSLGYSQRKIRIAIDRGGTFTDVHAYIPGSSEPEMVFKLLSVDPRNYNDAPTEGIRRVLAHFRGKSLPRDEPLDITDVESIRMGTTIATNALLERKGERVAFLTTKGFRDLLVIGNQARPHIFDLSIHKLQNLYDTVVEIDERITMEEFLENPEKEPIDINSDDALVKGFTGEPVRILKRPDIEVIREQLRHLQTEGFNSLAICFIHSYLYPNHEDQVAELARSMGFEVSVSSELQPTIRMVSRGNSATADAYLSPLIRRYVENFGSVFKGGLDAVAGKLLFMQSDGGLCLWQKFSGLRAILSGPAGGVIGFARSCYDPDDKVPVIGFDMGGTSTDVSRFSGTYDHVFETETAEVTLQTPQLDINTVAVGGGSILHWKNGLFAIDPDVTRLSEMKEAQFASEFGSLTAEAGETLTAQGFTDQQIEYELYLNIRYQGTNSSLMIQKPIDSWDFSRKFIEQHEEEFGFVLDREILVEDIRVRALGKTAGTENMSVSSALKAVDIRLAPPTKSAKTTRVYSQNRWHEVKLFKLEDLTAGDKVPGPSIILDQTQTILIQPGWAATVLLRHILLDREEMPLKDTALEDPDVVDAIQLSVFGHRFMSIAEQMGRSLNSRGLVANAPHIPCHLGAMSYAVAYQAERWGNTLRPGDVLVSNHPAAGGSHLPDVTVISPVIDEHTNEVLFWTASRAHHAVIGGIAAGSIPPHSKEVWQEGASFTSFKLVNNGKFDEVGLAEIMLKKPASYPGSSGTRTWSDNVSDLKAQIAANQKGIRLTHESIKEYGLLTVQKYVLGIQDNAEKVVRNLLRQVHDQFSGLPLEAEDQMDDGSKLVLKIHINRDEGSAKFDFTGTSREVYGNLNAPRAITFSATIYVLRSIVKEDIPLNQGCLAPINVVLPAGTILSPSLGAATVGGNIETSQRVTDLVLRASQAAAASQGTCNNLTFGYGGEVIEGKARTGFSYYETIAGGAGAGPTWAGQCGVHVHMTNTRFTDPESLERRYPCILLEFGIRKGSGGQGKFAGGDGCIRHIEFRRD
ncbi:hypotheticall protein, partial [Colletotrichum viniferum]